MHLFANRKRDKALALYARTLPARLAHDYGASAFYTKGQINKAIANLKLPADYAACAHAMFLPEDAYDAKSPPYAQARAAFLTHMPANGGQGSFYESGLGLSVSGFEGN